jgi:hypothetical protein
VLVLLKQTGEPTLAAVLRKPADGEASVTLKVSARLELTTPPESLTVSLTVCTPAPKRCLAFSVVFPATPSNSHCQDWMGAWEMFDGTLVSLKDSQVPSGGDRGHVLRSTEGYVCRMVTLATKEL